MTKILKTVLLYLLMALLPLSGMASVRTSCEQAHVSTVDASHSPCGDAASFAHAEHGTSSDKASKSHDKAGCSMCYVSTAAPQTTSVALTAAGSEAVIPPLSSAFAEYVPPGLDKPPR